MKRFEAVVFFMFFMGCAVAVFAQKAKDIPPWMEDVEESGRSTYLVPKGSRRKIVGSQVIVEPPNEYVARRLYEMEEYLRARLDTIEANQEKFQKELEELETSVREIEAESGIDQDLEELKNVVNELNEFKRKIEEPDLFHETVGDHDQDETATEGLEATEEISDGPGESISEE